MRIAVNTRFWMPGNLEGYGYFAKEVFSRMALAHPEHDFIFLFDRAVDPSIELPANVLPVVVGPKARHPFLFKIWYDISVPMALKKHKVDVLVSPDGFCSLTTQVPQCLVVHDLAYWHYPKFAPANALWYYRRYMPLFAKKAKRLATVSQFSQRDIAEKLGIATDKIDVVYSAVKEVFAPIDWQERELIKEQYANGCEYFLFTGAIHPRKNLLHLLKAFSIFKKRQKSNMKLLVAGRLAWQQEELVQKIDSYAFRKDVKLLGYVEDALLAKITASAYACVFPSFFEGFGVPILEAMKSDVPIITSNTSSMPEIGGDAALYADPNQFEDIAEKMMLLYKDENLRNRLINAGRQQCQQFSWQRTADLLFASIEKCI
jgi:glycosyltransferase involved in cell wall biosynthesis